MANANAIRTRRQRRSNVGGDDFVSEITNLSPRLSEVQKEYIMRFLQDFIALPDEQRTTERLINIALEFAPKYGIDAHFVEHLKAELRKEVSNESA